MVAQLGSKSLIQTVKHKPGAQSPKKAQNTQE